MSFLSPEVEGVYVLNQKEDIVMWDEFVMWLNDTEFKKVRGTCGRSYTGEGVYLKFKGVEEEFWITVAHDGKRMKFGDYVWKVDGDIDLPVDEAYLLKKKGELKKGE